MNRRQVLGLLAAGTAVGVAGGTAAFTFRWHSEPRRTPFLTAEHLQMLAASDIPRPRVLFIGNSMVLRHDVPAKTAQFAASDGIALGVAMAASDGARLIETIRIPELQHVLQPDMWDAVILQDFTKTPLRAPDRWGSVIAMNWIRARVPETPIILFPPWPAMADNPVYQDPGFLTATPRDPADYMARTMAFYSDAANKSGFHLAPVPEAWWTASQSGQDLYHADGHHANERGAELSAQVIWSVVKQVL